MKFGICVSYSDINSHLKCFEIMVKWTKLQIFIYLFLLLKISASLPPPISSPSLAPLPLPLPLQSKEQSRLPALWEVQDSPPSKQVQEGLHPSRLGSVKASTCSSIKTQCHCSWLNYRFLFSCMSRILCSNCFYWLLQFVFGFFLFFWGFFVCFGFGFFSVLKHSDQKKLGHSEKFKAGTWRQKPWRRCASGMLPGSCSASFLM